MSCSLMYCMYTFVYYTYGYVLYCIVFVCSMHINSCTVHVVVERTVHVGMWNSVTVPEIWSVLSRKEP